jgi:hypothetical protein
LAIRVVTSETVRAADQGENEQGRELRRLTPGISSFVATGKLLSLTVLH